MNAVEEAHLRGFRGALRLAPTACTIGADEFVAVRNRRRPALTAVEPNVAAIQPETFTAALEDLDGGVPRQGQEVRTLTQAFRIIGARVEGPLVHIDCAAPVSLA